MKVSKRNTTGKMKVIAVFVISFLFMTLGLTAFWVSREFGGLSLKEVYRASLSVLNGRIQGLASRFALYVLLPVGILLLLTLLIYKVAKKHKRGRAVLNCLFLVSCLMICVFSGGFAYKYNAMSYLADDTSNSFVGEHYVDPANVKLTFPKKKRNLIYIYLESMEMTSADKKNGGNFEYNMIPELTKLSEQNENFSGTHNTLNGAYSYPGNTWTMGGLLAQTSGLPFRTDMTQNGMITQKSFFPNLTTLGDILEAKGYNQMFMCGSDGNFAGRTQYFKDHGNYQMEDYTAAVKEGEIPSNYRVFWGYEDQKLFKFAKNKLNNLSSQSKPFNFTMLTVDTHYPNGWKCDLCKDEFGDQYHNVMACSSRQVYAFVKWCQSQSWYKNTTIIVNGDHPTMSQEYANEVSKDYTRKTFTAYINADAKRKTKNMRTFSTMDNFPTTLAALGVKIDGERLGLGTNLFSSTPTLSEIYGYASIKKQLTHATKELIELEPFENTEAIQQFQYGKAKAFGHKDILTIKKVEGTKVTVDITDFRPQKVVSKVYLEASNDMSMPLGTKKVEMKCLDPEKLTYEGTLDVKGIDDNGVYVQVMYESDEGMQFPLNRTYVDLTGNSTNTTTDTTATN